MYETCFGDRGIDQLCMKHASAIGVIDWLCVKCISEIGVLTEFLLCSSHLFSKIELLSLKTTSYG